jgi:hypothetical protein
METQRFCRSKKKKADIQFVNIDTGAIKLPFDERFNLQN